MQSQNDAILAHMKRGFLIDAKLAYSTYGCLRLAATIKDLRKRGHKIESITLWRGKTHWRAYKLTT